MAEEEKKEQGGEPPASKPRSPQKQVHKASPDTPGGAASEGDEGKVTVADLGTAVRVPGGGVRTDAAMAKKYKMEDELGKPATSAQKKDEAEAAEEGDAADAQGSDESKDGKKAADGTGDGDGGGKRGKDAGGASDGSGDTEDADPKPPWYEPITRRSWLAGAWAAFAAALGIGTLGSLRFLYPNVLFEPPLKFKAGYPDDFQLGVSDQYKNSYGVWIIKEEDGFYALLAVCTHLGCTPNWLTADQKFKCPCHGSGFYMSGINFEGPAPRPLERVAIGLADDGQILIDKSLTFQQEKGGWSDPRSYLALA